MTRIAVRIVALSFLAWASHGYAADMAGRASGDSSARTEPAAHRDLARSGTTLYRVGTGLAVGGLISSTIGSVVRQPLFIVAGFTSYTVGLPMLGVGAGRVERASRGLDPSLSPSGHGSTGWVFYGLGWFVQGAGLLAMNDALTADDGGVDAGKVAQGGMIVFAGVILHYFAWYQFGVEYGGASARIAEWLPEPVPYFSGRNRLDGAGLRWQRSF